MPIILFNYDWMIYNCYLACLAVGLGYLALRSKGILLKSLFGLLWLLFLPNTIYLFTDLEHLVYQWHLVRPSVLPLFLFEYLFLEVIGIITFLLSFLPFEKLLRKVNFFKHRETVMLIIFNFLIAFGMVLGRVERINSWQVFTQPVKVFNSAINVFISPDLLGLTVLFGLLCNFVYFLFRVKLLSLDKKYLRLLD